MSEQLALSGLEQTRLTACEEVIERGLQTFVEVGEALLTIRDNRLYRAGHRTFEDYCRQRWGVVASRARQLIGAAETVKALESVTDVTPVNEAQARELAPLRDDPERMAAAWQETVERSNGRPTAAVAREVVREYQQPEPRPEPAPAPAPVEVWSPEERELQQRLRAGETVVVSFRCHENLIAWANERELFVRVDRQSEWGNPFKLDRDGDRATVIAKYRDHFLPHTGLVNQLGQLRGKALGCWCAPEPCHGDVLAREAER